MDAKERTKMGYDLFNKGDMETFFKEMVDENTTWTFPGKEGVHPLSGVHKGPQAMMAAMGKIPALWSNFPSLILRCTNISFSIFFPLLKFLFFHCIKH